MALKKVHFASNGRTFWAEKWSFAAIFYTFSWIVNIVFPLAVTFGSDGLWIKSMTFDEQPDINFKHQFLVILELVRPFPGHLVYSTFPHFNHLFEERILRPAQVTNQELDHNFDGKFDEMSFHLSMPLKSNEEVCAVDLFLLFDYKLRTKVHFDMEAVVRIGHRSMTSGSLFFASGDLTLHQKELLHVSHSTGNFSHDLNSMASDPFSAVSSLIDLMEQRVKRRTTVGMSPDSYTKWTTGRDASNDMFSVKVNLNYGRQTIAYRPGFWFVVKWAWVQYLTVFVVIYFLVQKVRAIVFEESLIPTTHCSE